MRNSPRFALDVVTAAALGMLLWGACVGVGYRILPGRAALSSEPELKPASWRQPGIAACAGLGLLLFLGGVGVAAEIPWWLIVVPFLVVGLGLTIWEVYRFDRSPGPSRSVLVIGGLGAAAFFFIAMLEALPGLRFPLNPCDDMLAYLPMAHRLIETNGLVDPWNARRLQNLGGYTFLQALPVQVFGDEGIGVVETVIGGVFLAGLFVANGLRTTWARLLSVVFILCVPLLWVPRVNTTGVLIGSPLVVAVLAITVELRKALSNGDRSAATRWAVAGGLVTSAITSVRPNLGVLAASMLALGLLAAGGAPFLARLRMVGVAAASTVVAILPWSIASWRTVSTPFFPLFTGNQNRAAVARAAPSDFRDLADQAISLARAGPYLWVALGVLVIALVVRKALPDPVAVVIAAAMTGVFIAAFAFAEYFAAYHAFIRYIAPASQGLAVFFVCEAVRAADARRSPGAVANRHGWLVPGITVTAAVVVAALGYSTLNVEPPTGRSGIGFIERAALNKLRPPPGLQVSTPALERAYRRALAGVDADRTIAAVDRPYLIDFGRFDIPNMDLPGFTAPGGRFPFFTGPGAKVARLRGAGYDTLLASVPDTMACHSPFALQVVLDQRAHPYSETYRYYLDWADDITAIATRAPAAVQRVGPLLVIDLPRAQRELERATDADSAPSP